MYGSPSAVATKDFNIPLSRRKEESDLQSHQQMSSGMLRYRSAPSSLLGEVCENFLHVRPSSPDTESIFSRFLSSDLRDEKTTAGERNPHFKLSPETEQNSGFPCAQPQMLYHSQQQHSVTEGTNPIRQSSSPAGFFSHLNVDNGYGLMRGVTAGMKGQISFSSRQNSLSQISEMGSDGVSGGDRSPVESHNGRCFIPGYPVSSWEDSLLSDNISGFKRSRDVVALNQTELHVLAQLFPIILVPGYLLLLYLILFLQDRDIKNHQVSGLTHQFSLPKTSSEIEKLLQFQDSVPCKIRAKRGCATHPRSIAERVRRTRISERMRKLQELVPNMDKQTNTADMLDLAVDYIKDLQRQVKTITDSRAACTCSASQQKPYQKPTS